jgi:hypothetical protein
MEEPYISAAPSWDHAAGNAAWRPVDGPGQDDDAAEATWRWLLGGAAVHAAPRATGSRAARIASAPVSPVSMLAEDNEESTERQRIAAIFDSARAVVCRGPLTHRSA